MLSAITQLLLFQLAGELLARGLELPVPGPVLGMVLLFAMLVLRGGVDGELQHTAQLDTNEKRFVYGNDCFSFSSTATHK